MCGGIVSTKATRSLHLSSSLGGELYFVSSNKHKFEEVQAFLASALPSIRLRFFEAELSEPRARLEEVAKEKAREAFALVKKPLFVEDSGLFIDAYKGFPAQYSSWVYKTLGLDGVLKLMSGFEGEERRAHFKAIIAFTHDGSHVQLFEGIVKGRISDEKRGREGFGYDPIFIPEGYDKTFAEDKHLKRKLSHRYKALNAFKGFLEELTSPSDVETKNER